MYRSIQDIPHVHGVPCTCKTTRSGKVRCETPGCKCAATSIVHVAHILSNGRLADLYHCARHASDGNGTLASGNPAGYRAEAQIVQLSPMAFEVRGHIIKEVK